MLTDKFFTIAQIGHDVTLWILVVLSILSLAFIIERWLTLSKLTNKSKDINRKISDSLSSNNLADIETISKDSLEGEAISCGLAHIKNHGSEGLPEIFETYSLNKRPFLEKYLNFLATVGSNAPFIGLLGTVFGIMDAFKEMAVSQGDASAVMIGISKALIATAFGLIVAIPAVIAYNHFQRKVKTLLQSVRSAGNICISYSKNKKAGA